jgi:hypothetical protein
MSTYAIDIQGEDGSRGPYDSVGDVAATLKEYAEQNPDDPNFGRVRITEMRPGSTVGIDRSVWDFIEQ